MNITYRLFLKFKVRAAILMKKKISKVFDYRLLIDSVHCSTIQGFPSD